MFKYIAATAVALTIASPALASWDWETNGRGNLIATWDVSGC